MSGTWYTPDGTPRTPNDPTDGDDSYLGSDTQDYWVNESAETINQVFAGAAGTISSSAMGATTYCWAAMATMH